MTTFYPDASQRPSIELAPGVIARSFWGDRMTLALVELQPQAVVAEHSHANEQVGTVIEGEIDFTIGGETRRLRPGDVYVIPADVPHGVRVGEAGVKLVEVFSPVRENLKY
jgi:quercetin dioxygenase-like cupin family protein